MKRRPKWLTSAKDDLLKEGEYIAQFDRRAALKMMKQIRQAVEKLKENPELGRLGLVAGTRELFIKPHYIAVYFLPENDPPVVFNIIHTSRDYLNYVEATLAREHGKMM
jgi:addiction module RelE/StbE family toxin